MNTMFLSCDWGTSNFRLRLINAVSLAVVAESSSDEGVALVFNQWEQNKTGADRSLFYLEVLRRHITSIESEVNHSLEGLPIVVSGMASSTIGIKELPYKHLPFSVSSIDLHYEIIGSKEQFLNPIILISGARTENDVMRGEETQLVGCTHEADEEQVFIFPGTHSKHVYVQNGYAVAFDTYMTGEFFQLLSQKSILAQSIASTGDMMYREHKAAFEKGVLDSENQHLLHAAFMVRTNNLFKRLSKEENYWCLSGLLIGAELSVLVHKNIPAITIGGQESIAHAYKLAADILGLQASVSDVAKALVKAHAIICKKAGLI